MSALVGPLGADDCRVASPAIGWQNPPAVDWRAATHQAKLYKGEYIERRQAANRDKAVADVERHFNSAGPTADRGLVVVALRAMQCAEMLFERQVDEDALVVWSSDRHLLDIAD